MRWKTRKTSKWTSSNELGDPETGPWTTGTLGALKVVIELQVSGSTCETTAKTCTPAQASLPQQACVPSPWSPRHWSRFVTISNQVWLTRSLFSATCPVLEGPLSCLCWVLPGYSQPRSPSASQIDRKQEFTLLLAGTIFEGQTFALRWCGKSGKAPSPLCCVSHMTLFLCAHALH